MRISGLCYNQAMTSGHRVGLYIHIPFCLAKCGYCDFNSYAGLERLFALYGRALQAELDRWLAHDVPEIETVYFGGGTPTVAPTEMLVHVLDRILLARQRPSELTMEANPGTVNARRLGVLRAAGVNRISFGVQSLNDTELRLLGRIHDRQAAIDSVALARQAGFDNLNLDLIFGLPGQQVSSWRQTLEEALVLEPDHLSLYALTLEEDTPLAAAIADGRLPEVDDDLAAEMYEFAEQRLAAAGYVHYEISNWAQPGKECHHNLIYWTSGEYVGLGAGAWSRVDDRRWGNVRNPEEYVRRVRVGESLVEEVESLSGEQQMSDTVILGLRLVNGVARRDFAGRFGVELEAVYGDRIASLADLGLLESDSAGIRLTSRGRLLGNEAFERFLVDA
jgi:oxygen-independent coproporphyrinogen III oxidase